MAETDQNTPAGRQVGRRPPPSETSWKKGESGNPLGSSKKQREAYNLQRYFDEHPDDMQRFVAVGIEQALKGEGDFWRMIAERIWGKVPERILQEGATITLVWPHVGERKNA